MKNNNHTFAAKLAFSLFLILSLLFLAACTSDSSNTNADEHEMEGEEMEGMEHEDEMEHEHEEDASRIPNEGASIHIVAPEDGAEYAEGDDIIVEVEVMGFDLSEEGAHWHVYVNGTSYGMVMGGSLDQVLRAVDPGHQEITVFLAGPDHIELQDGDAIHIMVAE